MKGSAAMAMVLLTACGVPVSRPMPLAASGPVAIVRDGVSYIVDLQPVSGGAEMSVAREGAPFANDQGLEAKRVAEAFCASRNSRIDPRALGRFAAGQWVFDEGCA